MCAAVSYSARTWSVTGTCCVKVSPLASRWTSTDKVGGSTGGFAVGDPAFDVRRASGAQPKGRSTANHAIPRQIAFMARVLLRSPMFHHSRSEERRVGKE